MTLILASTKRYLASAERDGLEGIVSKRLDAPYRSGKSKAWIKVKNPNARAATRAADVPCRIVENDKDT